MLFPCIRYSFYPTGLKKDMRIYNKNLLKRPGANVLGVIRTGEINYIQTTSITYCDRYLFTKAIWFNALYTQITRVRETNTASNSGKFAFCFFETQSLIDVFAALIIVADKILSTDNYTALEMDSVADYFFKNIGCFEELVNREKYIFLIFKILHSSTRGLDYVKKYISSSQFESKHPLDTDFIKDCFYRYESYVLNQVKNSGRISSVAGKQHVAKNTLDELKPKSLDDIFDCSVSLGGNIFKLPTNGSYENSVVDLGCLCSNHDNLIKITEYTFLTGSKFSKTVRGFGSPVIRQILDVSKWMAHQPINKLVLATSRKDELVFYFFVVNFNIREVVYAVSKKPMDFLLNMLDQLHNTSNTSNEILMPRPTADNFGMCFQDFLMCMEVVCVTSNYIKYNGSDWFTKIKNIKISNNIVQTPTSKVDPGSIFFDQPLLLSYLMWHLVIYYPRFNFLILNTFIKDMYSKSFFELFYSCNQQLHVYEKTATEIFETLKIATKFFSNVSINMATDIKLFGIFQTVSLKNYYLLPAVKKKLNQHIVSNLNALDVKKLFCFGIFSHPGGSYIYSDHYLNTSVLSTCASEFESENKKDNTCIPAPEINPNYNVDHSLIEPVSTSPHLDAPPIVTVEDTGFFDDVFFDIPELY